LIISKRDGIKLKDTKLYINDYIINNDYIPGYNKLNFLHNEELFFKLVLYDTSEKYFNIGNNGYFNIYINDDKSLTTIGKPTEYLSRLAIKNWNNNFYKTHYIKRGIVYDNQFLSKYTYTDQEKNNFYENYISNIVLNTYGNIKFSSKNNVNLVEIREYNNDTTIRNIHDDNYTLKVHGNITCSKQIKQWSPSGKIEYIDDENALYVDGESTFTGKIKAYQGVKSISDISLKTDLKPISDSLEKIKKLTGYTFKRKDLNNRLDTGLIAQDVYKILPEAVDIDKNNIMSLYYGKMIGLIIESIKELDKKMDLILLKK
jgi:hypothetical protein